MAKKLKVDEEALRNIPRYIGGIMLTEDRVKSTYTLSIPHYRGWVELTGAQWLGLIRALRVLSDQGLASGDITANSEGITINKV